MWRDFEIELASHSLNIVHFPHGRGVASVKYNSQSAETGDSLTQEFEPLTSTFGRLVRQSRDVAARTRKARNETDAERIDRWGKDDWYRSSRPL